MWKSSPNQAKHQMERKHSLPHGKLEASRNKNGCNSQKMHTDKINLSFQAETEDFPLLHESVSNKSKTSGKFNQVTFSYSDKLKAVPPVPSSKICQFFGTSDSPHKSETDPNKSQNLHLRNNLLKVTEHENDNLQTNLNSNKVKSVQKTLKSFHSMPNQQLNFSKRKKDLLDENNGLKMFDKLSLATGDSISANVSEKLETNSKPLVPLNETVKPDDEGWTVYQKHSLSRKNQMQNNTVEANHFKKASREKTRNSEQASETGKKYNNNLNSYTKYKTTSNKYCENATSKYEYLKPKYLPNSTIQQSNEGYKTKVQPGMSSNRSECSKSSKNPNILSIPIDSSKHVCPDASLINNKLGIKSNSKNTQRYETNQTRPATGMCSTNPNSEAKFDDPGTVKSKKKRKSKVKRLAALQANKLLIITPEDHTRILTHSTGPKIKSQSRVCTNFTDNEEYPELGVGFVPKYNKKVSSKVSDLDLKVEPQVCSEKRESNLENSDVKTSQLSWPKVDAKDSEAKVNNAVSQNGEVTQEAKLPVHSNRPVTISLFDMLWTGKSKKKDAEVKIEEDSVLENSPVQLKKNKVIAQPVNPLSSSKPVEKRGKEREKPKVKKPTKMRKLILLGRQMKRESLASKGSNIGSGMQSDNDNGEKSDVDNDGNSLSSNVSPGYEEAIDKTSFDISSNNNLNVINSTLEDIGLSLLVSSCEKGIFSDEELQEYKLLLQTLSLSAQSSTTAFNEECSEESESSLNSYSTVLPNGYDSCCENENKTLDKNMETRHCSIVDTEIHGDLKKTLSCEMHNLQTEKIFEESKLFESELNCQLIEGQVSTLDAYSNTLVQTIIKDCMSEINLIPAKNVSKHKHENFTAKSVDFSNSFKTTSLKFDQTTRNSTLYKEIIQSQLSTTGDYSDSFRMSHLDGFSDVKFNENNSSSSFTDKPTSAYDNVPTDNLSVDHSKKFGLFSDSEIIEEFSNNHTSDNNLIPSMVKDCKQEFLEGKLDSPAFGINSSEFIQPGAPKIEIAVKEKTEAAKILLHSRKFRDYCTHFVTKELDETVFNLIDDLARFQDRLHQKDPVKARMKRRLMYGIKEIKKHMKLKKLKGIIIATDIEDNKTEGGLNDLVNEILTLAEAYHIPYVFSHKRFNLGKACRKPAPVSCVGIINYEGSEKNFKKMLELQEECKCDYNTLTKKMIEELTDNQIESLFDTVQKSVPPFEVSKVILKELFGTIPPEKKEKIRTASLQSRETSNLNVDAEYLASFKEVESTVTNCFINPENLDVQGCTSEKSENIHVILTKYNVIKP